MLLPSAVRGEEKTADLAGARRLRRRGATAMEYLVCASFILVALILGVQHLASVTSSLMQNDADATSNLGGVGTGR
jgi:Flp pilus assembly pilin Flp